MATQRVDRLFQSMTQPATPDPNKEILAENQSLHQRVAALQRTERDLLTENQDAMRQNSSLKKQLDALQKESKRKEEESRRKDDDFRAKERALEDQVRHLKQKIVQQEEDMLQVVTVRPKKTAVQTLSDEQIASWFALQDSAWYTWVKDFSSCDPNRLSSGLHPLQLAELSDGVKDFVRVTEDGRLPDELLASGSEIVQALLHGILVNFICAEILASPFWVFDAVSAGTLESPSAPPSTAITPGGFHLDLAMHRTDMAAVYRLHAPTPETSMFPPQLRVSTQPAVVGAVSSTLPTRLEMENVHHVLLKG